MHRKNITEIVFIAALLIATIILGMMAAGYTPRGRFFPAIILAALFVLLVLKILSLLNSRIAARIDVHGIDLPEQSQSADVPVRSSKWQLELTVISWLMVLFAMVMLLGFFYTIPLFLFAFLRFQGKHGWKMSIICSLAVFAFIYGIFVMLLSVSFPAGILFD